MHWLINMDAFANSSHLLRKLSTTESNFSGRTICVTFTRRQGPAICIQFE